MAIYSQKTAAHIGTAHKRRLIVVHENNQEITLHHKPGFDPVLFIRKEIIDDLVRALYSAREAILMSSPDDDLLPTIDRALSRYPFQESD